MLVSDDEIAYVDNIWLGAPGYTWPWRARFVAYFIALIVGLVVVWFLFRASIPLTFFTLLWSLAFIVGTTRWLGRQVTYETPLRSVLATFWHETGAPRPPKPTRHTFRPDKIKAVHPVTAQKSDTEIEPEPGDPVLDEEQSPPVPDLSSGTTAVCQVGLHEFCQSDCCECVCHE